MRTGALPSVPPKAIKPLVARVAMRAFSLPVAIDWFINCPPDGDPRGNDRLGNCVEVAEYRAMQIRRANAWGDAWTPKTEEVIKLYSKLTGYDPETGANDRGTDTSLAMSDWAINGIATQQSLDIIHWATLDPADTYNIKLAIAKTGPVQATIFPPRSAEDLNTWETAPANTLDFLPGSLGGYHRILLAGYVDGFLYGETWGRKVKIHPEWWDKYKFAVDATLSREWMTAQGVAASGVDWAELELDMQRMRAA